MKKILVLLTVVALVFCSFSCKTSESAATEPAPAAEPAPAPAEAAPAPAAEPTPAPAAAELAPEAPQAAVSADAYEAAILYLQDIDLRAKVPESKKNVEPWTKGVQIFAMGEQCLANGLYADAIPALKQVKKFWSGLVDPADIEIAEDGSKAYALLLTDFALQDQVPENKKNVEPWTKGVQIFEMGQGLFYRAMYTDSLAPLGQTKKFWSGLCENPVEVPEEAVKAGVLYYEAQYYRDRVPEASKTKEPYTKGVQIFAMGEQCIQKGLYADAVAPLAQAKKFWKGLCDIPAKEAAPAAAAEEPAVAAAPAVTEVEFEAAILYLQDIDLRAKVPESKKNVEPWTKGVQIFAMGEQCLANGLYADAIPALKQVKKFWSGLVDPADIEIAEDGSKAYALLLTDFALQDQVPENKKNVEPWTKGVQIFEMGQGLFYRAMYTDSLAPLGQTKKFWSGLCENPVEVPEEAVKAGVLYYEAQYYRDRVPEASKTKEPYTKGVQIFAMGEQCIQKGLYADAVAPLAQAKKFWKGLCDIPAKEAAPAAAGTFPEGKSVDTNWNAKWVFEADNNVKLYDSETGALLYDFAGKQKDLKVEGNKMSFRCDETQRFYVFERKGDVIEMDIDRDWTDEEYHITMSAE